MIFLILVANGYALVTLLYTVTPRYNAVVGVHDIGPRCKRDVLGVPVSATRRAMNSN